LRPGSNIKTKHFEFTPETAVYVMSSSRKHVAGDSEVPVAECVVCAWNGTHLSVEERSRRR